MNSVISSLLKKNQNFQMIQQIRQRPSSSLINNSIYRHQRFIQKNIWKRNNSSSSSSSSNTKNTNENNTSESKPKVSNKKNYTFLFIFLIFIF